MTTQTLSAVSLTNARLQLRDPDSDLWRLPSLITFLQDIDYAYLVSYERAYATSTFGPILSLPGPTRPRLLVSKAATGSLLLEFAQEFTPAGAVAIGGGAIVWLARLLRGGPGNLHQWFEVSARASASRAEFKRAELEERLQIAELEVRLRRIQIAAEALEIAVLDENGETILDADNLDLT